MSDTVLERRSPNRYSLSGPLTFSTVPGLYDEAGEAFLADADPGQPVELELDAVGRCDSAGLALLLEWMRVGRERGLALRFSGLPEQLDALMQVSDLDDVLGGLVQG